MLGLAWINGMLVDPGERTIGLGDRGLLYGDGLLETIRIYEGRPYAWDHHCRRLKAGCHKLQIPYPCEALDEGLQSLLAAGGVTEGTIRITVTRGEAGRGLLPPIGIKPTIIFTLNPGIPYPEEIYARGFRATAVSFPRNQYSPLVSLKTLNFLENILGRLEAAEAGVDEGIFLNLKGELAEGTVSNLFFVDSSGILVTPPPECGLLPGIARVKVLEAARSLGLSLQERPVCTEELLQGKEAFLTNSLVEVMPLVEFEGRAVGKGKPGKLTLDLRDAYRQLVLRRLAGDGGVLQKIKDIREL